MEVWGGLSHLKTPLKEAEDIHELYTQATWTRPTRRRHAEGEYAERVDGLMERRKALETLDEPDPKLSQP